MLPINEIRFYHYISSVLINQQADALCRDCKALSNTVAAIKECLEELGNSGEIDSMPEELRRLFEESRDRIFAMQTLDNAIGQKKAGNCKMPEGICFIKSSKAILNKIREASPS